MSSVMRSGNCIAIQLDKSFGKHSELERYISKTNGEIKKKKIERGGRQALMVPARINGNRRKIMSARLSCAAPGCDYISIVHTFILIIHGDVYIKRDVTQTISIDLLISSKSNNYS